MDEKDLQIIEEDSRQHPQCTYSQSLSKSQSNVNGKFVAEIIKHVQRHCPGERPVDVISSKTVSDNKSQGMDDDDFPSLFGFPFGIGRGGGNDGGGLDPFSMIEKFMRFPDSNSNGSKSPWEFGKPWDFGRSSNDEDSVYQRPSRDKTPSNKIKGGVISGPIEEI